MSKNIDFKVAFKSNIVPFSEWSLDSTVEQVKQHLEQETDLPIDSQKLMWKGKILKDLNVQLKDLAIQDGGKMMLMGSLPVQIEKVNVLDKKIDEQRRLAPTLRLKKKQMQQQRKPNPNANFTFHKISVIPEFPNPEKAQALLERLRDDRGVSSLVKIYKAGQKLLIIQFFI
jgi:hypothetical protein